MSINDKYCYIIYIYIYHLQRQKKEGSIYKRGSKLKSAIFCHRTLNRRRHHWCKKQHFRNERDLSTRGICLSMGGEESKLEDDDGRDAIRMSGSQLRQGMQSKQSEAFMCFAGAKKPVPGSRSAMYDEAMQPGGGGGGGGLLGFDCCAKKKPTREEMMRTTRELHNEGAAGIKHGYQAAMDSILDMTNQAYFKSTDEMKCKCRGTCICDFKKAKSAYGSTRAVVDEFSTKYGRDAADSAHFFDDTE